MVRAERNGAERNGAERSGAAVPHLNTPATADGRTTLPRMVRFLVVYEEPEDAEAFDRHYRQVHVPLAKRLPGLRRYTVNRGGAPVRGEAPFHLVAELDWDDMAALEAAFASPEGRAAAADVEQLRATVRSMIFEVEEL